MQYITRQNIYFIQKIDGTDILVFIVFQLRSFHQNLFLDFSSLDTSKYTVLYAQTTVHNPHKPRSEPTHRRHFIKLQHQLVLFITRRWVSRKPSPCYQRDIFAHSCHSGGPQNRGFSFQIITIFQHVYRPFYPTLRVISCDNKSHMQAGLCKNGHSHGRSVPGQEITQLPLPTQCTPGIALNCCSPHHSHTFSSILAFSSTANYAPDVLVRYGPEQTQAAFLFTHRIHFRCKPLYL